MSEFAIDPGSAARCARAGVCQALRRAASMPRFGRRHERPGPACRVTIAGRVWAAALASAWLLLGCGGSIEVGIGIGDGDVLDVPKVMLSRVADGFDAPLMLTHAGDGSGRLFVVEKAGRVRVIDDGAVQAEPFLDIRDRVRSGGSEQGLLSIAFAPDFAATGQAYVLYTEESGIGNVVLSRFTRAFLGGALDPSSERVLLRIPQPFTNHNGGHLAFGPGGLLYVSLGDGGGSGDPLGNGQRTDTLLGKLLRIDISVEPYAIPPGNPFGDEIWALGLRNPWRFSFDRATGDLFIGDVGQDRWEEIDVVQAGTAGGQNFGWNRMEGFDCFAGSACDTSGLTLPIVAYRHAGGDCSVTGGFVYRGRRHPGLRGIYFHGDFCSGRIRGLWPVLDGGWSGEVMLESGLGIASFGEDEDGELYVVDLPGGVIYRLGPRT
ncbi:MAG: PQQ-dependent sugar dehydrogenase [Rhodocyclaceae bacterium]|nr:PQQ-dependent sugar dehydrogenase [Rhodocyclaceae bacterium]